MIGSFSLKKEMKTNRHKKHKTRKNKQTERHKDFKAENVSWSQISHLRVVSFMFQDHFSITLSLSLSLSLSNKNKQAASKTLKEIVHNNALSCFCFNLNLEFIFFDRQAVIYVKWKVFDFILF